MPPSHPLALRYADLVDDPRTFEGALQTPLPGCFWVHEGKAPRETVLANLDAHGIAREPVPWYPGAYRVGADASPAKTLAYLAGGLYVQEEIAMTAVFALDVRHGHRVLDMCAAPGGKTAQASVRAGDGGTVFANESNVGRMAALGANVNRLALPNVVALRGDGREVPAPYGSLDRVICDVPCSGEGTARKVHSEWRKGDEEFRSRLPALQIQLLRRALHQTRPGGLLVYSTCTFAPEENEGVLHAALADLGEVIPFPWREHGLVATPGVASWKGVTFRSDVANAARFWPHHNDTGGFFVALVRRSDVPTRKRDRVALRIAAEGKAPHGDWRVGSPSRDAFRAVTERFGLPTDLFDDFLAWEKGNGKVWLTRRACAPFAGMAPEFLGVAALRGAGRGAERGEGREGGEGHDGGEGGVNGEGGTDVRAWPTTSLLQWIGAHATRNVVELDFEQGVAWARGDAVATRPSQRDTARDGRVLVRCCGLVLGHGALESGVLRSLVPGGLRQS